MKMKHSLSLSTLRKYLFIRLKGADKHDLTCDNIEKRVKSAFTCRVIIIGYDIEVFRSYDIYIGIYTTDASKHLLKKKIRSLFPEFDGQDLDVKAHKGWGIICLRMTDEKKNLFVCGDQNLTDVFELARASRKHQKLQLVHRTPEKGGWMGKPSKGKVPLKTKSTRRGLIDKSG